MKETSFFSEVNRRDYRAWYGLGQTYEILKMHFYCLYYYKKAHELRPNDSRMLVALGESYEKLNKLPVMISSLRFLSFFLIFSGVLGLHEPRGCGVISEKRLKASPFKIVQPS